MIGTFFIFAAGMAMTDAAPATTADYMQATPRNERRICRTQQQIGSRLRGTVRCLTASEWAEARREARSVAERIQRGTAACIMGGNDPAHGGPILVCSSTGP